MTTTIHEKMFPFDEIRAEPHGDYFHSVTAAQAAGFDLDQIWSVVIGDENGYCYGPHFHYVNLLGYVCTNERHDGDTYYIEVDDWEDDEGYYNEVDDWEGDE